MVLPNVPPDELGGPRIRPSLMAFGLLFAWLAGVGRCWDNRELWLQSLGLGSLLFDNSTAELQVLKNDYSMKQLFAQCG